MNHRSNMDYVLARYLAADQTALSYAVGEWARIWPLSALIRSMGAYFVRRDSGDELYRRVLERYIAMATEAGVPQAVFPEGGLTRDGRLREPRLGAARLHAARLPTRTASATWCSCRSASTTTACSRTARCCARSIRRRRGAASCARSAPRCASSLRNLGLALRSRWYRFGYACVNFGAPVSMRGYCAERGLDFHRLAGDERRREVAALGRELMDAVGRIVPVLPVPLIASVLVRHGDKAVSELELKAGVGALVERLRAAGAHVYVPRQDFDYAIHVGLRMLRLRRIVGERDGLYFARTEELPLLAYYANSIAHLIK